MTNKDNTRASEADQGGSARSVSESQPSHNQVDTLSEFAHLMKSLVQQFRQFNLEDEAYSYDLIGFGDWLEFEYKGNGLATISPEASTGPSNPPSSPPPDTLELDKILDTPDNLKARFVELDLMEQALNSGRDMYKYKLARLKDLEDRLEAALQKKLRGET